MPSPLLERMKTLCSLPGPPGHEGAVRDAIAEMLKDSASGLRRDPIGNLIARHEANESAPHLVLECHMDEVGLIVTSVEAGGAIRFEKVGLVADAIFPGREVALLTLDGNLHRGVVNVRSGHLQSLQGQEHPGVDEMWIDLGASDDAPIRALGIEAGTPGVFHSPFTQLPGGAWKSKAVDNRSGCALCVEAFINTANSLSDRLRLSAAFCAQEEIGGRGASVLSVDEEGSAPASLAIVLDNVPSDGPGRSDARGSKIGAGPVLRRYDHQPMSLYGYITPPELIQWVKDVASDARVPLQEDVFVGTFLDSATLSKSRAGGLPTVPINMPRRYSHSPVETFMESDLEAMAALIGALLRSAAEGGAPDLRRDYLSPSDG